MAKAEDLISMIPSSSLDEATVKRSQNRVQGASASQGAALIDKAAATDLTKLKANQEIQKSADLAEIVFRQKVNEENAVLQQEVQGTRDVVKAYGQKFEEVLGEYQKGASNTDGFSFFSHPVATIRNHVTMGQQKDQLNTIVDAMNAGRAHIDSAYADHAQKINDYKSTVVNLTQAELLAKAHEVEAGYNASKIVNDAEEAKRKMATIASEKQQSLENPYDRARAAKEKDLMDSEILKFMWKGYNNFAEVPFTTAAAETMGQIRATGSQEDANVWSNATARNMTALQIQRKDGETPEAYQARKARVAIANAGETDGPQMMKLISGATTTEFNPLFKLEDAAVQAKFGVVDFEQWAIDNNVPGGVAGMNSVQQKTAVQDQRKKMLELTSQQRAAMAGESIAQDMTTRASYNTSPPIKFAQAATMMAAKQVTPEVVNYFASDAARLALENGPVITGNPKTDVALNLMESMKQIQGPKGKPLTDGERALIVATYLDTAYKADYALNGDHGAAYQGFHQLHPRDSIPFQVNIEHRNASGKPQRFNLADPVDIQNLVQRQEQTRTQRITNEKADKRILQLPSSPTASRF